VLEVVVVLEVFDAAGFTAGFAVPARRFFGLRLGGGFGLGWSFSAGGA
jgi:hypothetical protein